MRNWLKRNFFLSTGTSIKHVGFLGFSATWTMGDLNPIVIVGFNPFCNDRLYFIAGWIGRRLSLVGLNGRYPYRRGVMGDSRPKDADTAFTIAWHS